MHGVGVDEFALTDFLGSFGFGWDVGLWRPVKRTVDELVAAMEAWGLERIERKQYSLHTPIIHAIQQLAQHVRPDHTQALQSSQHPRLSRFQKPCQHQTH